MFRLVLDPSTGSVTKVIIVKSTGFSTLDYGASISLQKWRFKPGKWQQVDELDRYEVESDECYKPGGACTADPCRHRST